MRNSRILVRQLLGNRNNPNPCAALAHPCNSRQTLTLTSVPAAPSSLTQLNLEFPRHRNRRFSSSSKYPDWKWNKLWNMHVPWEDRRLFIAPAPEIDLEFKHEYDRALKKVKDKSLAAVFCFYDDGTHAFCFIESVISRWAKEFPHVALYKVFVSEKEEDHNNALREFNIKRTPTFHFFQNGNKVDELASGSVTPLQKTLKKLYGRAERRTTQGIDTQIKKDKNDERVDLSVVKNGYARYGWKLCGKCPCDLCSNRPVLSSCHNGVKLKQ